MPAYPFAMKYSLYCNVQKVFMICGLENSETVYNFHLIWRIPNIVTISLKGHRLTLGEVRLNAIKNELVRRELNISCYHNKSQDHLMLAATKELPIDHIKAAYGLLSMLNYIAYRYSYADIGLFKNVETRADQNLYRNLLNSRKTKRDEAL
ncbi:hypothetical protein CU098_006346, partial [Rhizopus stolonifer]